MGKIQRALVTFLIFLYPCASLFAQHQNIRHMMNEEKERVTKHSQRQVWETTDDSVLTLLGRWAWGPCWGVDVQGEYAYISNGSTFQILDISDSLHPVITGEYVIDGLVAGIHVRDSLAYVSTPASLMTFDITDKAHPQKLGEVVVGCSGSFALSDSFAYVLGCLGGMCVVDISNPDQPYVRGCTGTGGDHPMSISSYGHYMVISHGDLSDFMLIDATDPDHPTPHYFDVGGWGDYACVVDTVLYAGMEAVTGEVLLRTYTVSDPLNPQLLGSYAFPDPLWSDIISMSVKDSLLFLAKDSSGLHVFNVANPNEPVYRGNLPSQMLFDMRLQDGVLYSGNFWSYGMQMIVVHSADSLEYGGLFPTGNLMADMVLRDNIVYAACGYAGLWIIDISDPQNPVNLSNMFLGGRFANRIIAVGDTAYILASGTLHICSVSDKLLPVVLSDYGEHYRDMAIGRDYVYVTRRIHPTGIDTIMEIIDVRSDTAPHRVGYLLSPYYPYDIAVNDSVAFIATSNGGLRMVDIRTPSNPVELGHILGDVRGVIIRDTIAFAAGAHVYPVNISHPLAPVVLDTVAGIAGSSPDMEITGNYLYWSGEDNLVVIDVSDVSNCRVVGSFFPSNYVASENSAVLASYGEAGIYILRNTLMTAIKTGFETKIHRYELYQNYPNPFNGTTTIRYFVPTESRVEMTIYNVLGQEVRKLASQNQTRGNHVLVWDGKNDAGKEVSSGVYIYRFTSGTYAKSRKLLYLK